MFHIRNKRKQSVDKTNSVAPSATGTPSPSMRSERRYSLRRVPSQLSSMLKSIDLHHGRNSNNGSDSHLPQADNINGRTSRRQSMTKATIAKISSSTEQHFNKLLRHTRRGSHQQQDQPSHLPLPRVKKDPFFNPKRASWSPFGNERWSSLVQVKENAAATTDDTTAVPSTPRLPPLEDQSSLLLDVPSSSVSVTNSTGSSNNSNSYMKKRRNSIAIRHHDTNGDTCAACLASSRQKQTCPSEKIKNNGIDKTMNDNIPAIDHQKQQNDYTIAEKQQQPLLQEVVIPTTPLSPPQSASMTTPTNTHASESTNTQEAESSNSDEKRVGDMSSLPAASVAILQAISGNDNHAAGLLVSPCVKQASSCQLAQNIVNCIQLVDQVESTQTLQAPLASLVQSCFTDARTDEEKLKACQSLLKQIDSSQSHFVSQVPFSSSWSLLYPTLWLGGTMTAGSIVSEHAKTGHIVIAGTCIANDKALLPKEVKQPKSLKHE